MTIEQTIEIPASRRVILEIPEEVPTGKARLLIQFPIQEDTQTDDMVPVEAKGQIRNEAFRSAVSSAYGAWKDKPWTNCLEEINNIRNEWEHRDPWNSDPVKKHRD